MTKQHAQMIVLMGVSGCGKSTIGLQLAKSTGIAFYDGDDFHSDANKAKMSRGESLNDSDREPWLQAIVDFAQTECDAGRSLLVACSALKRIYREQLRTLRASVKFAHLAGSMELIEARLSERTDHFMPKSLLQSQFDTLESPAGEEGVIEVSIDQSMGEVVNEIEEFV